MKSVKNKVIYNLSYLMYIKSAFSTVERKDQCVPQYWEKLIKIGFSL